MKRVGIIGLEHETNTFRPASTPLNAFTITRGDELLAERGRRTYAGGMFRWSSPVHSPPGPSPPRRMRR